MKKYDTIIFDLDGTLLDTLEDLKDSVNYVLDSFHYPQKSLEEIRSYVGNGIKRLVELSVPEGENNPLFEEAYERFATYYTSNCQIKTNLYNGILEVLKELKLHGYKMAIVSNKNQEAVNELQELYFKDLISIAIGARDEVRKKPAPDSVIEALHSLGASKEHSLYVGDSEVDKATADNASLDCVLVSWGFRGKKELILLEPMEIIDQPDELLELLELL